MHALSIIITNEFGLEYNIVKVFPTNLCYYEIFFTKHKCFLK